MTDPEWFAKPVEKRQRLANRMKASRPGSKPIRLMTRDDKLLSSDRNVLLPADSQCVSLYRAARRRLLPEAMSAQDTIVLMVGDEMIRGSDTIGNLYEEHKDRDGFMHVLVTRHTAFG